MSIIQVSSREFREKQAALLNLADQGQQVIIHRAHKQSYMLIPVQDNDICLTPEAEKRIEMARKQYLQGEATVCNTHEELHAYLESL